MHDMCLIHTDLKPENILLVSPEYIKVPDYKVLLLSFSDVALHNFPEPVVVQSLILTFKAFARQLCFCHFSVGSNDYVFLHTGFIQIPKGRLLL